MNELSIMRKNCIIYYYYYSPLNLSINELHLHLPIDYQQVEVPLNYRCTERNFEKN